MARGAPLWSWSEFTSRIASFFFFWSSCTSGLIPFKWAAEHFLKCLQSKAASSGSSVLHKKKKDKKKESLWSAISAVNKHTSDKIANLTSSYYTSTDLLPLFPGNAQVSHLPWFPYLFLSRERGASGTSEDWLYMIPVQIKNSLFQADTVAEEGGHREHLETRCSAVCQHHLPDLTHRRVRLCTLAWTGMCQAQQLCTKTHAHT